MRYFSNAFFPLHPNFIFFPTSGMSNVGEIPLIVLDKLGNGLLVFCTSLLLYLCRQRLNCITFLIRCTSTLLLFLPSFDPVWETCNVLFKQQLVAV